MNPMVGDSDAAKTEFLIMEPNGRFLAHNALQSTYQPRLLAPWFRQLMQLLSPFSQEKYLGIANLLLLRDSLSFD